MDEELLLRVLTGQVVGKYMMRELNRVAFLSQEDTFCISLISSASSSFITQAGGNAGIFIVTGENITTTIEEIERNHYQALFLGFGGKQVEEGKELFHQVIREVALRDLEADIIVHLKMLSENALHSLLNDREITLYLQGSNNLYVYTVDFDKGFLILNFATIHENHFHIEEIEKFPISFQHTILFNSLIKNRNFTWRNE